MRRVQQAQQAPDCHRSKWGGKNHNLLVDWIAPVGRKYMICRCQEWGNSNMWRGHHPLKNLVTRWHCSTRTFLIPKGGDLGSEMLLIYNSSCKVAIQFCYNAACKNADTFQCWSVAYIML